MSDLLDETGQAVVRPMDIHVTPSMRPCPCLPLKLRLG